MESGAAADYPGTMLAYLDPAAGSMILQAIVAGVAGAAVAGKFYWSRVKRTLRLERRPHEAPEDAS